MKNEIEIPEGWEAKIVGNKVVFVPKESEDERNWKAVLGYVKDDALRVWLEKQKEHKPKMTPKWLYRLEFKDSSCGLWYDGAGKWCFDSGIGAISGCKTKTLPMGFDERYKQDGRDWFSSCSNKEDLMHWYSLEDAKELISKGFVFTRYLATEYHEYDQQTVFIKDTALYREEIDIFELFGKAPGWSDEDDKCVQTLVDYFGSEQTVMQPYGKTAVINWLKSLRSKREWMERLKSRGCPKTSDNWKPSDKQIEALEWQVNNTSEGSWQRNETETLLKALKEIKL